MFKKLIANNPRIPDKMPAKIMGRKMETPTGVSPGLRVNINGTKAKNTNNEGNNEKRFNNPRRIVS